MDEYTPLDLKTFHNAGLALLAEQGTAPIGPQQFRGLPFLIGTDPQCCFVAFGDGWQNAPLSIPIAERAQSVIVAHRLLVSGISAGGPVGEPIADYVFTYQNGDEVRADHSRPLRNHRNPNRLGTTPLPRRPRSERQQASARHWTL